MKKIALVLVALMFATNIFAVGLSAGVKGDLGISTVVIKMDPKPDVKPVFTGRIGGVFGMEFSEMFALEPELMLHFRNGYSMGDGDAKASTTWTTLEIPVMAKIRFELGTGRLALAVGPQLSFLMGKIKTKSDAAEVKVSADDAGMKSFAFGIAAGAEYGLPVGPGDLVLGVRWQMDITDMEDNDIDDYAIRSMSVLPSVAYMFKF